MFTIPYVHVIQSMHDFKFLINTFFTVHGHASSSGISKWAYKQYAYFVSHIHASILSIFLFTHCIVKNQDGICPPSNTTCTTIPHIGHNMPTMEAST
jgi:hypothetical protein